MKRKNRISIPAFNCNISAVLTGDLVSDRKSQPDALFSKGIGSGVGVASCEKIATVAGENYARDRQSRKKTGKFSRLKKLPLPDKLLL